MIYIYLIAEFFQIGLFSYGGGLATVPFLYHLLEKYGWYSTAELNNMIAISTITPGPIGLNIATYAGLKTAGLWGALCATVSEVLPSFIIILIIAKILKEFKSNFFVESTITTLKPICAALLFSVAIKMLKESIYDKNALILFGILCLISLKKRKNALFYIVVPAICGIILKYFSLQ